MHKYKIIFFVLMAALTATAAYGQEKPENQQIKSITGTVINADAVGNIITIRTESKEQMSFSVPDKASITQETHNIGLMDIGKSDFVNIQYYLTSASKYLVVSIVDNESVVNE